MKTFRKATAIVLSLMLLVGVMNAALLSVSAEDSSNSFRVTSTSNLFPTQVTEFDKDTETLTTTWFICITQAYILNIEWIVTYDPDVLSVSELNKTKKGAWNFMPGLPSGGINNPNVEDASNEIRGNHSATDLMDACTDDETQIPLVSVTWDVKDVKDTTVNLQIGELTLSRLDPDTGLSDSAAEQELVLHSQILDVDYEIEENYASVYEGSLDEDYTNPPIAETTAEPTTIAHTTAEPTTAAPTTAEPTTIAPTTAEPTTAAPVATEPATTVSDKFKVTSTSNLFPTQVTEFDRDTETLTTTWFICITQAYILNIEWIVTYDPDVLSVSELNKTKKGAWNFMPGLPSGGINNPNVEDASNEIRGNHSATDLMDACTDDETQIPLVSVTWDVKDAKDTTVDLRISELTLSRLDPDTGLSDPNAEQELVLHNQLLDVDYEIEEIYASVYEGALDESYTNPEEEPTTIAPTTAMPTTIPPTTVVPTTIAPTTAEPTTIAPTTAEPTTIAPTTAVPTTIAPTTAEPTTIAPTTAEPTTIAPATSEPETVPPVTEVPTPQYTLGDVDGDGEINVRDATEILKYTVKLAQLDAIQLLAANVNGDGEVNVKDAAEILKYTVKLDSALK